MKTFLTLLAAIASLSAYSLRAGRWPADAPIRRVKLLASTSNRGNRAAIATMTTTESSYRVQLPRARATWRRAILVLNADQCRAAAFGASRMQDRWGDPGHDQASVMQIEEVKTAKRLQAGRTHQRSEPYGRPDQWRLRKMTLAKDSSRTARDLFGTVKYCRVMTLEKVGTELDRIGHE
ncbi:hypothetical protein BDN67DRAFT_982993 [Paxillus ammoniavirescens]|nr:hypothetical protein BDN67DRAFT_982993 [Paxillus ammoniavirescens]